MGVSGVGSPCGGAYRETPPQALPEKGEMTQELHAGQQSRRKWGPAVPASEQTLSDSRPSVTAHPQCPWRSRHADERSEEDFFKFRCPTR